MVKQKRRVSARELSADIRAGMDDASLMAKYHLTEKALAHLLTQLVAKGVVTRFELDNRGTVPRPSPTELETCPACGHQYVGLSEECPKCGIVASKYKPELPPEKFMVRVRRFFRKVAIVTAGVLGVVIAAGVLWIFLREPDKPRHPRIPPAPMGKASALDLELMKAAGYGEWKKVRSLIKQGANVNFRTDENWTPLIKAAKHGSYKTVKILLDNGADVNVRTDKNKTAVTWACATNNSPECASLILDKGADINAVDDYGDTPLLKAAYYDRYKVVEFLMDRGANPNIAQKQGVTPLMDACQRGNYKSVAPLVSKGADVNARNDKGWTALMMAAEKGRVKCINALLKGKVDVNAKNDKNQTALMVATRHGNSH